ncbi:aldo/keto reductase [Candidatus Gottesmanbacteria bacterium]|nr:aldo/keto reductase [Candidatus Gottesmanbacteria bacterium]
MQYTVLGKTGLKVSKIGFGAWGIGGGAPRLRWADMWKANDADSKKSLALAHKHGINFYDTALIYGDGHSERLIAEVLGDKDIVILTKVPPKNWHWPALPTYNINDVFPKDHILEKAHESYKNLGGKTIDILLLHVWTDAWIGKNDWREAFRVLKKEGIAKFFGVSVNDHEPESVMKLVESEEIDVIEIICNIFDQSPTDKLFPLCREKNIGTIARAPLDEGSLSGAFNYNTAFNDWRKDYFTKDRLKITVDKVNKIKNKLVTPDRTMAQIALKFCISGSGADIAITGMRNPHHVPENAKSVDIKLSDEEMEYLRKKRWVRNFYPPDV